MPGPLAPRRSPYQTHPMCVRLVTAKCTCPSSPTRFPQLSAGWGKLPKLPPRSWCCRPPLPGRRGRGKWGKSPSILPHPSPHARQPFMRLLCCFFFNTANVYHLPNRLDRFCFLSSGAAVKPPRLPRSRLPAPSRADLVFRAAPRRISVCKTKCFDGGRLQECLEAVWSFMGCAVRSVLARRAGLPGLWMGFVIFSPPRGGCRREQHLQGGGKGGIM